jgi:N utilization substance protein A
MNLDLKAIQQIIKQLAAEKNLSEQSILETLDSALAAAYRKDFGQKNQNIIFELDVASGEMKVYDKKIVVDFSPEIIAEIDVNGRDKKYVKGQVEGGEINEEEAQVKFNPKAEILLADAKKIKKSIKVGDELIISLEIPDNFGRMAAQTAKQVIIQKIREAERESVYKEFKEKENQLTTGIVQRKYPRGSLIDLSKITALLPFEEQVPNERYNPGERMKFYIVSVNMTVKGPEVIVSRAAPEMLKKLFETEIPEINSKAIEIMAIAREAGFRSKVAVKSNQENIDPIGSCVGQRGSRIQTIINELGGEKVDIIEWHEDEHKFISNALSPAKVIGIEINEKQKIATVTVAEDQLSLAIGKEGQNVRLAAKLTGWKINILKETPSGDKEKVEIVPEEKVEKVAEEAAVEKDAKKEKKEKKKKATKEKKKKTAPVDASASADASASVDVSADESVAKEKESKE